MSSNTNKTVTTSSFPPSSSSSSECLLYTLTLPDQGGKTSDRLFSFDANTIGLVSSTEASLRFLDITPDSGHLQTVRVKHFRGGAERPFDACTDPASAHIYVVFPDENKLAKYHVHQGLVALKSMHHTRALNRTRIALKELVSVKDVDFSPTSVACGTDHFVYVSQKFDNQVRVYDRNLRLTRIIALSGVVTSPHHALAVNEHARVLLDGLDSVALFHDTSKASSAHSQAWVIENISF